MSPSKERLARELHYEILKMDPQNTLLSPRAHNAEILGAFLNDGVEVRVRLSGHSMKPLLRNGSVLSFARLPTPQVGDIVLLTFPNGAHNKLVAHRVVSANDEHVWTQGDSSMNGDPPVPRARVLGTATSLELRNGVALPLGNVPMRAIGLLLSWMYPSIVRAYRIVVPRKEPHRCAN